MRHELSYDQHWEKADRTYKVMRTFMDLSRNADLELATNAPQTGPLLAQDFPEFENVVRVLSGGELTITDPTSNDTYIETGIHFADPDIYEVFDIPLIAGDWESALQGPFRMVINEELAQKYFPNGDAVGGTLIAAGQAPVQVTGVMETLNENTHLGACLLYTSPSPRDS